MYVKCPRYVATTKEQECYVRATGNSMVLDIDFGDGSARTMDIGGCILLVHELNILNRNLCC